MNKLIFGFKKLSDANFGIKAEAIATSVSEHADFFPTPIPTLAVVTDAIGVYLEALVNAKSLDRTAVSIKNQRRADLDDLLGQLGRYIMQVDNGDITILIASGFELAKTPEPTPPLEKPENFMVQEGINSGTFRMQVQRQKNVRSYQFQVTTSDPTASESEAVWVTYFSSTSKTIVSGLVSGKRYWCRVGIIGSYSQQLYSDVITKIAQ